MTPDEFKRLRDLASSISPQDFDTHTYDRSPHSKLPYKVTMRIGWFLAACTPKAITELLDELSQLRNFKAGCERHWEVYGHEKAHYIRNLYIEAFGKKPKTAMPDPE